MLYTSTSSLRSRSSCSKKDAAQRALPGGFTLVELLVVISIMLIITSTLLLRQQKFDSATVMRTLAYSIALSMRQAQVYGTGVVGADDSGATTFAAGYGISLNSNTPGSYQLFADLNDNGWYDTGEGQKTFNLGSGYSISNFCAVAVGTSYCSTTGSISTLAVLFKRPNPDAQFTEYPERSVAISSAYIQLHGPGGDTRAVKVTTTGQISVCGANKPIPEC